jgi:hypothetical protein
MSSFFSIETPPSFDSTVEAVAKAGYFCGSFCSIADFPATINAAGWYDQERQKSKIFVKS